MWSIKTCVELYKGTTIYFYRGQELFLKKKNQDWALPKKIQKMTRPAKAEKKRKIERAGEISILCVKMALGPLC